MGRPGEADPLTQTTAPPTPPEQWLTFFRSEIAAPPTVALLVAFLGAGIVFDFAVRRGPATLAFALCELVGVGIVLGSRRFPNRQAQAAAAAVLPFAACLVARTSPWLVLPNVISGTGLLLLSAVLAQGGSIWELSVPRVVVRAAQAAVQPLLTPAFLIGSLRGEHRDRRRVGAFLRGIAIAVPLVVLLGALLASADAVFASIFEFDVGTWISHAALIGVGTIGMGALIRLASVRSPQPPSIEGKRLGVTEWTIVLGALDLLFAVFAVARLLAMSEGGRRVIESAGLTYAEYARSGFFQLLAATAIAVAALAALRAAAAKGEHERRFRLLGLLAVILTLAIVVSAFHRLVLYEDAFGLTMLRLYSHTAIVWVGLVLVLLGIVFLTRPQRPWLTPAAGLTALVLLLALNVMNPEAFVAKHNLADEHRSAKFDPIYLRELGDDAIPTIAENLDRVDEDSRLLILDRLCPTHPQERGWAKFNLSRRRGEEARARLCR